MPGNRTKYQARSGYLPFVWHLSNVPSAQSTPAHVGVSGHSISRFSMSNDASVVVMTVQLSTPVTQGWVDFEITRGGAGTGWKIRMNAAAGTSKRLHIKPGKLLGGRGDRVGVRFSSSGNLLPDAVVDAVAFFEVQWD